MLRGLLGIGDRVLGHTDDGDDAAFLGRVVVVVLCVGDRRVIASALAGGRHTTEGLTEGGQAGSHDDDDDDGSSERKREIYLHIYKPYLLFLFPARSQHRHTVRPPDTG